MKIEKVGIITLAEDYAGGGKCLAQHGVSFLIEVVYQTGRTQVLLFDTGFYHDPIIFNANRLNAPLEKVEKIILSHAHYDHTGGLLGLLGEIGQKVDIIAHPHVFKQSYYKGKANKNIGMENIHTKELAEQLNAKWKLSKDTVEVLPAVTFLGEIPRKVSFEQDLTIQLRTQVDGKWVDDQIEEDSAISIDTPKGLIIISGCSHAGIVNIVNRAIQVTGKEDVFAVIGGFHLISADDTRIDQTSQSLKDLNVENIITGHCTGGDAEYRLKQDFKESYQKLFAGKRLEFSFKE